jgi:hypothetical protein
MPRGAEVDAKNEDGMQCRVVGEERTDTRREMETNVCTDRKHMNNQLYCLTELQQLKGGGEFLWLLHEVLNKSKLLVKELGNCPRILKTFCFFFIAARYKPTIKNISGFRGFILKMPIRLNNAPIRCKRLSFLPLGD